MLLIQAMLLGNAAMAMPVRVQETQSNILSPKITIQTSVFQEISLAYMYFKKKNLELPEEVSASIPTRFSAIYLSHSEAGVYYKHTRPDYIEDYLELYNTHIINEAKILNQLNKLLKDPQIPRLLDCGTDEDGKVWIKLKGIRNGKPLSKFSWNLLNDYEKIDFFIDLAKTIEKIHKAGFVHNDIKPDNIIVNDGKQSMLIDFGLSGRIGDEINGRILGEDEFDKRGALQWDILCFGKVLSRMFLGYVKTGDDKTKVILNERDVKKSGLETLIKGMNEKDAAKRQHKDMRGVIQELEEIRQHLFDKIEEKENERRLTLNFEINKFRYAINKGNISRINALLPHLLFKLLTLEKGDPDEKAIRRLLKRANRLLSVKSYKKGGKKRRKKKKHKSSHYLYSVEDTFDFVPEYTMSNKEFLKGQIVEHQLIIEQAI